MKYPQRKIDVLKWLANAPRAISVGEILVDVKSIHHTLNALIKDGAIIEHEQRYTITQLGKEIINNLK